MSSYIYIASDSKLLDGSIGDQGFTFLNTTFYPSENALESFYFERNSDPDENKAFSFSKHFSSKEYQVASIDLHLPIQNDKKLNRRNKKALQELYNYIKSHFINTNATYIEILFSLNGYENEPLKLEHSISCEELSINDLFYEEHKFIKISRAF